MVRVAGSEGADADRLQGSLLLEELDATAQCRGGVIACGEPDLVENLTGLTHHADRLGPTELDTTPERPLLAPSHSFDESLHTVIDLLEWILAHTMVRCA